MAILAAFGLGIIGGVGVLLVVGAVSGDIVVPSFVGVMTKAKAAGPWVGGGLVAGVIVFVVTGWIVAAVAAGTVVAVAPRLRSDRKGREEFVARTEAIATWTEMIRDNMAGAAGLEQALIAASRLAPAPIKAEVDLFVARAETMPLVDALALLGRDLANPSGDMVVVAITNAVRMQARELGPLLTRLATTIRSEVRMRLRVEVGRTRIRTSAKIVVVTTIVTILFMFVATRNLLEVYDSLLGQIWLVVVLAVFAVAGWLIRVFGAIDMPDRFTARHTVELP